MGHEANIIYCGLGSRGIIPKTYDCIVELAQHLAEQGWILRSGGADGADSAFEEGCDRGKGAKEIFIPWKNFNGNPSPLYTPSEEAFVMAQRYHPAWHALTQGGQKLHARNCHQVLGADLQTPVHIVICWTPGCSKSGGTGQALRVATDLSIPILDLGANEKWNLTEVLSQIKELGV